MATDKIRALAGFLLLTGISLFGSADFKSIGYYPDYNRSKMPVTEIRFKHYTHVIFFSIYPDSSGNLKLNEVDLSNLSTLVQSAHTWDIEVLICVGGWGLSGGFGPMAASASARDAFIQNCRDFCLTYNLDGVNLDWEPVWSSTDRANYTTLIGEMKPVLAQEGLSLSVAVSAQGQEFLPAAIDSIDWLGVMAYDLGFPHSSFEGAVAALAHWEAFGFERSRMVLGVPFYGRDEAGVYYSYRYIMEEYKPVPEADIVSGISYNGIAAVAKKTEHAISNGYGGVMFWEITQDTSDAASLLTAAAGTVHLQSPPDFDRNSTIDAEDFMYFASRWLQNGCGEQNTWCGRADINASGSVSLADLAVLAAFWTNN